MRLNPRKPVNDRTILARKRKALFHSRTLTRDVETQEVIPPSRWTKLKEGLRKPLKRSFWKDRFEPTEDEVLVDSKLLSYAYLEAGMIEMLGE